MPAQATVLLLGGTGRTGGRVLQQLLDRGASVRLVVRSAQRLRPAVAQHARVSVHEAELLALDDATLERLVRGCDAVVSCLGHVISFRGVFGPPRDLVLQATTRLCRAIESVRPAAPIRFILMSSVSVHRPRPLDGRRGAVERALLALLRGLVPPARDNQRAAEFLWREVAADNPFVQWAAVRPDTLVEGEVSAYTLHEGIVGSLISPGRTRMANVAHFMCELATSAPAWTDWKGKLPLIVDADASGR